MCAKFSTLCTLLLLLLGGLLNGEVEAHTRELRVRPVDHSGRFACARAMCTSDADARLYVL